MWRNRLRSANSLLVRALAVGLCLIATNIVWADEGLFWEASAPGRPVLILMPTLHMLPDQANDISAVLAQALRRVNSVVIESPIKGDKLAEKAAVRRWLMYPAPDSLENHLAVLSVAELKACIEKANLPYQAVIHLRPFAVSLLVLHRIPGPAVHEGIEGRLYRGALAGHRQVSTLLTSVENIEYLGAMPQNLQELALRHACAMLDNPGHGELVKAVADDWRRGDGGALAVDLEQPKWPGDTPELMQADYFLLSAGSELFFTTLIGERIQSMKGPILVAIGAGHLVGQYSMLRRLEKAGYVVRRITLAELPVIPFDATDVPSGNVGSEKDPTQ
jgi:uncharacterized protein YbaP (TraB family)